MRTDIKFTLASHIQLNYAFRIGVGPDGSLWVPADFLRLSDAALEKLQKKYGQVVLIDVDDGVVYVEARAVTMNCENPVVRKIMEQKTASLLKQLIPKMFPDKTA
jgi:hypothetical protein